MAHRVSHRSLAVAALSTVVEWYDFTLYLYFATVVARVFFGGGAQSRQRIRRVGSVAVEEVLGVVNDLATVLF